jgi:hypothetical protein
VTARYIVRVQQVSDAAVIVTAKIIVRAQHASDVAVGVTSKLLRKRNKFQMQLSV